MPGTNIAVDECIQHFEGRSSETVVVTTKPTPEGFKLNVFSPARLLPSVAAAHPGSALRVSGTKIGLEGKRKERSIMASTRLNPWLLHW